MCVENSIWISTEYDIAIKMNKHWLFRLTNRSVSPWLSLSLSHFGRISKTKTVSKKMRFKKLKSTQSNWCSSSLQYRSGHLSSLFFFNKYCISEQKQLRPCVMAFYLQNDWLFGVFCSSKERESCRDSSQILFFVLANCMLKCSLNSTTTNMYSSKSDKIFII